MDEWRKEIEARETEEENKQESSESEKEPEQKIESNDLKLEERNDVNFIDGANFVLSKFL